jgi:hypothetical protein
MGKQRSVQTQTVERGIEIVDVARSFADHPERFEWLRAMLAARGYDAGSGILVELRSVPDQGCWVHYGMWLTNSGAFLKFVADEAFGSRLLEGSGRLEQFELEDVSEQIATSPHLPGTGRSFGWLALDALRLLGMSKAREK